jgi:DNA-binding helix-hairpin-helix protein with protein kinase domain
LTARECAQLYMSYIAHNSTQAVDSWVQDEYTYSTPMGRHYAHVIGNNRKKTRSCTNVAERAKGEHLKMCLKCELMNSAVCRLVEVQQVPWSLEDLWRVVQHGALRDSAPNIARQDITPPSHIG